MRVEARRVALRGSTLSAALAASALVLALALPSSAAAIDIIAEQNGTAADGWQAGTCEVDPTNACSPDRPDLYFRQAAGHPPTGFTQIIVKHQPPGETPVGDLKTVRVDLPVGLSVNPEATPQCELGPGEKPSPTTCPPESQVGTSTITASLAEALGDIELGTPIPVPPVPVYNLVPRQGEPARFGFELAGTEVYLDAGVAWESDYHEFFTIHVSKIELPIPPPLGELAEVKLLRNRLVFFGTTGLGGPGGPFLTNPSTCLGEATPGPSGSAYSTWLHAESYQEEAPAFPSGAEVVEAPLPPGVEPTGCADVPFEPSVGATPGTERTDTPSGPSVEVRMPFDTDAPIANSNVRTARVSLPLGLGLNPAAAPRLAMCGDAQFGKGTRNPIACPPGSEIGSAAIETPVLPPGSLRGTVYLGQQLSRDPLSGNAYRIFIAAESARFGQSVRLIGRVFADPTTGQLTTVVEEAPQLPFISVTVDFDDGRGALTSPPTCGPNRTTGLMTPWSGTPDASVGDAGFHLTSAPGGGPCAAAMAQRPFAPGFAAAPDSARANAYTPFRVRLRRADGEQELKLVDVTLPRGATAKLRGVPYCPPAALAAAAASAGAEQAQSPSCPAASQIGSAATLAGSGPEPLRIEGKVFLSGPYKGAPLSLAVVTPATAGPFDLGTVVVRVALFVDPESARIRALSDPIPDVFGGAKLSIRAVDVAIDRRAFSRNGSNCRKGATAGWLGGGGANPADPAAFSSLPVSSPFRAVRCKRLRFAPRLNLRLFGEMSRAKHPRLRAVLRARGRDANIRRASVALPHALFLDQSSLATVCTRVQFAAEACPRRSVYGHARATSPLLGKPLRGPVYLRSSDNPLPDLVAHLRGQVTIDLVGRIDSFRGGIRTTFTGVPDVPVRKFTMVLPGGKRGLLEASRNLCSRPVRAIVRLHAHNGRRQRTQPVLRTPCPVEPNRARR